MKLRLRFLKHTIVTEFIDDSAAQLTVADVAERAQNLFEEFLFGLVLTIHRHRNIDFG